MKKCPFCAEEIQSAAVKCKHCNEWLKPINCSVSELITGKSLKTLRQQKNMTLGKLSMISGVQPATLSRMENNKKLGSLMSYVRIAKALGLKLSELFAAIDK